MTTGWKLSADCRERLLASHAPRYAQAVADHVTFLGGEQGRGAAPPEPAADPQIVGHTDDGAGVEAMVVAIAGSTDRPDGSTWHITWSLGEGRTAKESNAVIAEHGWSPLDPLELELEPASW